MSETKAEQKIRLRKAVIIGHRKRKGLCKRCGKDIHEGECIENYIKSDMRGIPEPPEVQLDLKRERKKETIISYRKKKNLCERCGKDIHNGACIENYIKSDNRTEDEKIDRPAVIPTPKEKAPTILEEIEVKEIISVDIDKTKDIKLHRDFITINLENSNNGNRIDFKCIGQISKRFNDYIICLIGDVNKILPYSDVLRLKKLTNINHVITKDNQMIVNYITSSKKLFTFPNILLTPICIKYNIPIYEFSEGKNATNFLSSEAFRL